MSFLLLDEQIIVVNHRFSAPFAYTRAGLAAAERGTAYADSGAVGACEGYDVAFLPFAFRVCYAYG